MHNKFTVATLKLTFVKKIFENFQQYIVHLKFMSSFNSGDFYSSELKMISNLQRWAIGKCINLGNPNVKQKASKNGCAWVITFERTSADMQFAFSYFYYLKEKKLEPDFEILFNRIDIDGNQIWSDREIRYFLSKLYEPPVTLSELTNFEESAKNCSLEYHFPSSNFRN